MKTHIGAVLGLLLAVGLSTNLAFAASIVESKHNLSITGKGIVKANTESEICVFCHVPHRARRDTPYLWNRSDSTAQYIPYQSSTLRASVGQPTGASRLCLSCHDGTVAMGLLLSRPDEVTFAGGLRFMPAGPTRLGTDLSDDHPVSLVFDSTLTARNPELRDPASLPNAVKLDRGGELQCTACHDPHDTGYGKFLVMSDRHSGLCTACHDKRGWGGSSHSTSDKTWNGLGANPWGSSPYATVRENGCASCHVPHAAAGHARLTKYAIEEDNCLICHTGNVATKNIATEITKPYGHFVQNYAGVHDPAESFGASGGAAKHVECADCHNPHHSSGAPSPGAPAVSGAISGVSGIDVAGQSVASAQHQFEICYKCHADNNVTRSFAISRQLPQLNTRLEFSAGNPSFHPVATETVNPNVPSLLPSLPRGGRIFCTDCHNNDSSSGPRGPHGSNNATILVTNYSTADNTEESPYAYALCYSCHSRASILGNQSFKEHRKHVVNERAPCSACHDAHGVSASQGNPINNAYLINFDLSIVQPDSVGRLYFRKDGVFRGTCYLRCHGENHAPENY